GSYAGATPGTASARYCSAWRATPTWTRRPTPFRRRSGVVSGCASCAHGPTGASLRRCPRRCLAGGTGSSGVAGHRYHYGVREEAGSAGDGRAPAAPCGGPADAFYRSVLPDVDIGSFPRRATAAAYPRPFVAGDAYTVGLDVERVGTSSITYTWVVIGPAGVCVRGEHTVVHVGADGRPAPVPPALRERLATTVEEE